MVEYENSSGLIETVPARIGRRAGGESRSNPAGRAVRLALTAALLSSTALIAASGVAHAQAVDRVWAGATDAWATANNWVDAADGVTTGVPVAGDNIYIGQPTAADPVVSTDLSNTVFGTVQIGLDADQGLAAGSAGAGTLALNDAAAALAAGAITLGGATEAGTLTIAQGALTATSLTLSDVAGNTFTLTAGSATINGATTVNGGAFTTAADLNLNGALDVLGGTFDATAGTVDVTGALAVSGAATFTNSGAATAVVGAVTLGTTGVGATAGNLAVTGGTFVAQGGLTLNNGAVTLSGAGAGGLTVGVAGGDGSGVRDFVVGNNGAITVSHNDKTLTVTRDLLVTGANGAIAVDAGALNVARDATFEDRGITTTGGAVNIGGALTLSKTATFSNGGTTATTVAGVTTLGTAGDTGTAGNLTVSGGTFKADGGLTVENGKITLSGGGALSVGKAAAGVDAAVPAPLTVKNNGELEIAALNGTLTVIGDLAVSGKDGGFTVTGGSTIDVTGDATITDRAVVLGDSVGPTNGTITVKADADAAAGSGKLTIAGEGSVALATAGSKIAAAEVALAGASSKLVFNADPTADPEYLISGQGGVAVNVGSGNTISLAANNTFAGGVTIKSGAVDVTDITQLGGATDGKRTVTFDGNASVLQLGTAITNDDGLNLVRAAGANKDITVTANVGAGHTFELGQKLTGTGNVTLGGDGTVVIKNDANDFVGKLVVGGGTVQIDKLGNVGKGVALVHPQSGFLPTVDVAAGGILAIAGTELASDTGVALSFAGANSGLSIVDATHTFTLKNAITNGATFVKKGEGTLVLEKAVSANNTNTGLTIEKGTVVAEKREFLGASAVNPGDFVVTLDEGFLKVGGKGSGPDAVGILNSAGDVGEAFSVALTGGKSGGFDVDTDRTFTLNSALTGGGTLVKRGEGKLVLTSAGAQVNNILEGGLLSVTDVDQLGAGPTRKVTFVGGGLGVDNIANDTNLDLVWGSNAKPAVNATIDVASASTLTITHNAFGKYDQVVVIDGVVQYEADGITPKTQKATVNGNLIKKGEGTLVLENKDIAYNGGTEVHGGVLKGVIGTGQDDATKFRFKDGKYTVNGGTLELDTSSAVTITELAGSGATGTEILNGADSYDPKRYNLNAGEIKIADGTTGAGAGNRETTLTVKETTGEGGFWGKITGLFAAGVAPNDHTTRAGKLVVAADLNKEVVLTGNKSEVKAVEVTGGTLRVNDGTLPVDPADVLGAKTTHNGVLTADTVSVNGSADNRASLAGSGAVVAAVTVGEHGALRGDRDGTLNITGDVTFADGATIELGRFLGHKAPESGDVTNQYFDVTGTVTAAAAGNKVNLNDDGIDPGVYRVIKSSIAIDGGDRFAVGTIGDLPAGSITLGLSDEGKNLDLFSTSGRADLRYWNGGDTWTINGTEWTSRDKTNAGRLHPQVNESVVGVFGYTGFPQGGTVNVTAGDDATQYLTQGLQFFAGDWTLTGASIELKGGATDTSYENVTTIDTVAGNVAIGNSLTGSAALRKKGVGSLTLSGANTYEGGTVIDSGTLTISADANLGKAGTSVTLNGAGATLVLAPGFADGSTDRDVRVNLPTGPEGSVNQNSTIDLGGNFIVAGGLTGNGLLNLANGFASFAGNNAVSFGGTVNVASNATLLVDGAGAIGTANVEGTLSGSFGHTLTIDNLKLASSAKVWLSLPEGSNGAVTAFKGTNATLGGEISALGLPEGYAVGSNGTSLYVFDYLNRSGEIVVSDAVKTQYADSNFTFGGVVNGYLVLNAKTPAPQPGAGETVDVDKVANLSNWSETTFVDGQTWNNGVATFNGHGTDKPINVEGQVRIAGLTINGENFLFKDAGVTGKPGAFLLQAAAGTTVVNFTVAQNGSARIAIPIGGSTDFAKTGLGHLDLSGNSPDFTGTGTVQDGTLYVTGNFANGSFAVTGGLLRVNGVAKAVTVGPNGTLEGVFTGAANSRGVNIGTLVVNGGTLSPGNSPGTLRVGGLSQTAGVINFEPGDKIEVLKDVGGTPNGQAVFSKAANGAQVDLRLAGNTRGYTYGHNYTFVTAENGVSFTTADAVRVTELGNGRLFSSFRAEAVGNEGRFFLQRDRAFATQAWSVNQLAVADVLEGGTPADLRSSRGPIYDAIASASNDEAHLVRAAFEQLSGEIHASAKGVLIDESRHLREATVNRTRSALSGSTPAPGQVVQAPTGSNIALWGQAYGSWGNTSSTTNTAKLDRSTGGFVLGFDTGIADTWRLGIAGGYAKSDIKSNSNLSKADVDNYNLAVYGGSQFGNLGLRFGFGHTWHRLDTERQLNVLGLRDSNHAKYDARTLQLYAEAGYEVKFEAATVEPFLNLAYVNHHSDSFVERGLGLGSALTSHGQNESTGFSTLGLRLSKNFDLSGAKGTASGTLGWRHAFGDVDPHAVFSAGSSLFAITGAPIAKNAFVLGVGLDVEIAHGTTLSVSYNGQVGNHTTDHGVKGNFSVKF